MMMRFVLILCLPTLLLAEVPLVFRHFVHVRNAEPREWSHFPDRAEFTELNVEFDVPNPSTWKILSLRQAETKQRWLVLLNDQRIGELIRDHNDQESAFEIPAGLLRDRENRLRIYTDSKTPDDIKVGQIELLPEAETSNWLKLSAAVVGEDNGEPLPCRFTIVDAKTGMLARFESEPLEHRAVRAGVVYALDGRLDIALRPERDYRVYVGRGFEYELLEFAAKELPSPEQPIVLHRQVPTPNLVACDTHLHSFEFARHGDCTLIERLVSIAGEGIELPISTEHEQHIDYRPEAERLGADRYFTPVVGCEVTTHEGHFNSFPIDPAVKPAEHKLRPWDEVFRNIFGTGARICIINHARDVHRNFRPLDPVRWDLETGQFTDGRKLEANGIELINSGATQTDPFELVRDWMALLRSGHRIAGVGSSDSHTVNFAIPGQGRTYIAMPDGDPSNVDVDVAVEAILEGKTHVSFGLLTTLKWVGDQLEAEVLGPDWTQATSLTLFKNGDEVEEVEIAESGRKGGLKSRVRWQREALAAKSGDFFVAVARGPGITGAWWPMMPPYQPDSPDFEPYVIGISPAVYYAE